MASIGRVRAVALAILLATAPVGAQSLRGVVMDAANDRPIAAAIVWLEGGRDDRDRAPGCASPASGERRVSRAARTDSAGEYHIAGLMPGRYTLCVRALGYVPRTLGVTLDDASTPRVHVGLPALPTMLAPLRITRVRDGTFGEMRRNQQQAADRASVERLRQARYLTSDARILTMDDVTAAAGLGEMDVMRAVQQLPGVATRDDYTTAPWTRGAPGNQTMVTFDGLPLFDPYHGVGAISSVNPEAVGDAAFHPGVAPTEVAAGGAGTLALRSRRATTPGFQGTVGASGIAATARLDAATHDGRAAGTLSLRRSHLDFTNRVAAHIGSDEQGGLPYAFDDAAGRGDLELGKGWHVEGSALFTRDRLWAPVSGIVDGGTGHWGGHTARVSLDHELLGGTLRTSIGNSASGATLLSDPSAPLEQAGSPQDSNLFALRETVFRPQPIDSRADLRVASVSWHGESDSLGVSRSGAGIDIASWRARFTTDGPWPHSSQFFSTVAVRSATTVTTLWAERLWQPSESFSARTGARLELGPPLRNAPSARVAPRFAVRYAPSTATSFSLAAGGTYQYAQTLAPPGPGRNAVATTDAFWVVAGPEIPVLATRTATLGAERWLWSSLLASTTAYWRDDLGVLLADPREGYLVDRPLAVEGRGRAAGVEMSLRSLGTRWNGGVSYASGKSTMSAYDLEFAAPSERRWIVRAQTSVRAAQSVDGASSVHVGLAWESAAGAPFTRYYGSVARCDAAMSCRWMPPPRIGPPSDGRGHSTHRLDATADGTWAARTLLFQGYLQLRNVTRAENDAAYLASVGRCSAGTQAAGSCHPELLPQSIDDTRLPPLLGWLGIGFRLSRRPAS